MTRYPRRAEAPEPQRCMSMAGGRRRCDKPAAFVYRVKQLRAGRVRVVAHARCEDHPLAGADSVTKVPSGGLDA